jgi:hypothetical protein
LSFRAITAENPPLHRCPHECAALKKALPIQCQPFKSGLLQRKIEVRRTAHILVAVQRVVAVRLIQRRGAFLKGVIHLALLIQKMSEPVVLAAVFLDGLRHAVRDRNLVAQRDDLFGTFDDPCQNAFSGIFIQVLAVILDVALALILALNGITMSLRQIPSSDADARQMVGVQHQRVAGLEGERVFVLLLREHIIRGAELLDGGIVEPCTFLHFGSDQKALALDLRHFRLDVPAAADGQGICGDVAAVKPQHTGDGIPEGGLAVSPIAVGNDEGLHINLADSGKTADHLDIVDELLIFWKMRLKLSCQSCCPSAG